MVTLTAFYPINSYAWYAAWSSDLSSPTFRIYRDGILLLTTPLDSTTLPIVPNTSPVFEILDDPAAAPTPAYPSTVLLTWLSVAGAASYNIDQYAAGVWTNLDQVADDGSPVFNWQSDPQPDGQTATFRVVPVGANGNAGTAITFSKFVVRFPDVPSVAMTYSAGTHEVTIAAA